MAFLREYKYSANSRNYTLMGVCIHKMTNCNPRAHKHANRTTNTLILEITLEQEYAAFTQND